MIHLQQPTIYLGIQGQPYKSCHWSIHKLVNDYPKKLLGAGFIPLSQTH